MTRIYTRTGDKGESGLMGGTRFPKHHPRFEALGALDEANAALGWAACVLEGEMKNTVQAVQHRLFNLGAQLAGAGMEAVDGEEVRWLEEHIDACDRDLPPLTQFILPGGTEAAARLHLARTVVRRAERALVALAEQEPVPAMILAWINRLSDLLFVLARAANGGEDVLWEQGE